MSIEATGRGDGEGRAKTGHPSVLFLSNNFPPEVNALANRTAEHAREWVRSGGKVEVLAGPPHFPEGSVYEGYRNRLTRERLDGVDVMRVPMYVTANEGFVRRTLSYVSYLVSATWYAGRTRHEPEVVVASSPHFFAGLAGWLISRRLRKPFVLEVRDLWPESIVDVGAMSRGPAVRMLERLEAFLYRSAEHVVIVSPAFRDHVEACGVSSERITVLPNGVDLDWCRQVPAAGDIAALRAECGIENRFVVSYIGTVGMAHGLDVLLEAAERCEDPEVVFVVVGAGAEWARLEAVARRRGLDNVRILPKQPRDRIRSFYALSDASIVHLRDRPAFRKVIPSKMFESMAMQVPIVLGVDGQARAILEEAGAGIAVRPEDAHSLLAAILELKSDARRRSQMGAAGATHAAEHYDRRAIAARYWRLLQSVAMSR